MDEVLEPLETHRGRAGWLAASARPGTWSPVARSQRGASAHLLRQASSRRWTLQKARSRPGSATGSAPTARDRESAIGRRPRQGRCVEGLRSPTPGNSSEKLRRTRRARRARRATEVPRLSDSGGRDGRGVHIACFAFRFLASQRLAQFLDVAVAHALVHFFSIDSKCAVSASAAWESDVPVRAHADAMTLPVRRRHDPGRPALRCAAISRPCRRSYGRRRRSWRSTKSSASVFSIRDAAIHASSRVTPHHGRSAGDRPSSRCGPAAVRPRAPGRRSGPAAYDAS